MGSKESVILVFGPRVLMYGKNILSGGACNWGNQSSEDVSSCSPICSMNTGILYCLLLFH